MKSITLLITVTAVAAAQKATDYFPECSIDCLEESVSAVSDCSFDDAWCICVQSTYEAITAHGTSCVMQACGSDVAVGEVLPAAIPYCEAATASHEGDPLPTATATSGTGSVSQSATSTADGDDNSADADEEDDDSSSTRTVPVLLGMLVVAVPAAAIQVWA
ncbi:uncharacterized protein DNG_05115 [Cephalotrichum gorgonifer]|uniref:CFEM domain-containing protein n=1 Tax=Cephalotrichum gorgonifer TaxID=2041049 RepID=A0AAE8N0A2_9PEZI|nr:uncharacterized protein DNG_05115 [Cephalotrichum gorgonifer]